MSLDPAAGAHVTDPVFVLCAARSGSTLLRFILDAHPDLACPPETNVAGLFSQMAAVWTQFEVSCPSADPATGAQVSAPGTGPGPVPSPPADPVPVGRQLPSVGQIPAPVAAPVTTPRADPEAALAPKPESAGESTAVPGPVVIGSGPSWQEPVLDGIRRAVDDMIGSYLRRRGKKRYCDKSLNTAAFVDLLVQLYPAARFICLYRHPMDVIASGVEACPWGLSGYGFEPYAASSPGNTVHALAHFWADNTASIVDVAARYPNRCIQVRYEDMVTDPELVSAQIFRGLGLPPAPGVSQAAFGPGREFAGPSDFKIWQTSGVSAASLGRGWSVPVQLIGPGVLAGMNNLTARLGYRPVDGQWGTTPVPPDPRLPGTGLAPAAAPAARRAQHFPAGYRMLASRVEAGVTHLTPEFALRWAPCSAEAFVITATPPGGSGQPARWRVDLATGTVGMVSGGAATAASLGSAAWDLVGSAEVWEQVVSGQVNLSVAIRHRDLRLCEFNSGGPTLSRMRVGMLADLLSLEVTPPGGLPSAPAAEPVPARGDKAAEEKASEGRASEGKKTRRRPAAAAEPGRPRPRRSRPRRTASTPAKPSRPAAERKEDQAGRS